MASSHHEAHLTRVASLLASGQYSDLTITCRTREFHVHRNILCPASRFFKAACDGEFQEAHTARIDLSDDDPEALQRTFRYLYTADYDDEDSAEETGERPPEAKSLNHQSANDVDPKNCVPQTPDVKPSTKSSVSACLNNALTYALAEKYDIQGLKELAKHKFKLRSSSGWTEANLLTLLEVVYNTTPTTDRGLRDIMSTICCSLIDCTAGKLLSSPRYQGLISKDGTLAFDALTKTYEKKRMLDRKVQTLEARVKQLETGLGNAEQTTQALASQLNSAKEWEEQEQETLKHLLSGETCYYCSQELRVSVEKHPVGTDKHLRVKCQSCGKILQKLKP